MKRRIKRNIIKGLIKFMRFWDEWGISWEEFEMLLGAISVLIIFPVGLRLIFALFGV